MTVYCKRLKGFRTHFQKNDRKSRICTGNFSFTIWSQKNSGESGDYLQLFQALVFVCCHCRCCFVIGSIPQQQQHKLYLYSNSRVANELIFSSWQSSPLPTRYCTRWTSILFFRPSWDAATFWTKLLTQSEKPCQPPHGLNWSQSATRMDWICRPNTCEFWNIIVIHSVHNNMYDWFY